MVASSRHLSTMEAETGGSQATQSYDSVQETSYTSYKETGLQNLCLCITHKNICDYLKVLKRRKKTPQPASFPVSFSFLFFK